MNERTVTTLCFGRVGLEQALDGAAEAGFDAVELVAVKGWIEHVDPDDENPAAIKRLVGALSSRGLHAVSLAGHSDIASGDGYERHRRLLRMCAELGIPYLNTFPGASKRSVSEREALVENARRIGDEAATLGITVCLENDGGEAGTGEEVAALLREIRHEHVRMNYDPANSVFFGGADPLRDLAAALPWTEHFHLKDHVGGKGAANFPPLGEGELDISALLLALGEAAYDGPICLEIEFDGQWPELAECVAAVRRSREYWDAFSGTRVDGRTPH